MIKVTDAKYTKRFNLGDYSHEEYSLTGIIEEGEDGTAALVELREAVQAAFAMEKAAEKKEETTKQPKKGKKNAKQSAKPNHSNDEDSNDEDSEEQDAGHDDEGNQDNEASDLEDDDNGDDSSDSNEASEDGDESEEVVSASSRKASSKKSAKEKPAESKKSFRKKPQAYNRGIEQHKEIFSSALRSVAPNWKKDEASKKKAKSASEQLEGTDFLDESGVVLPSFLEAVKKLMTGKK